MKIVLVHYRYFVSGGPERYMFNITDILKSHGHEVIPFSVKHNKNHQNDYEDYFLEPIGTGDEVYGHEYKKDFKTVSKVLSRMIYSFEAKRKFKELLAKQRPDLVYVLQYQNKISCSVIDAAYDMKIPIVQRISDFGHICIDNIFYHYQTKTVCEACLKGSKFNAIKKKCANNSLVNSMIKVLALKIQDIRKTRDKISSYIIPAKFTVEKFEEFGVSADKIYNIPTFFNPKNELGKVIQYNDYFVYVGRVDPDKGLFTLVNAFKDTNKKLVIIGSSIEGYDQYLKDYLGDEHPNIVFTGNLEFDAIRPYLEHCICTICPSEWYDNFPNAVLESYAYDKAVIASYIGSLKDLVTHKDTGLHFEAANVESLKEAVDYMYNNREEAARMGKNSYQKLITEYSSELHYSRLMNVFTKTIANFSPKRS